MAIADRRARERLERERLIVDHADELLKLHGYQGLNLDELAERVEYSKATIYNHFESKEDILAAVDCRHLELRAQLFNRALLFKGGSRERIFVVGWADQIIARMYPHWSSINQLVTTASFHEKVTDELKAKANRISVRCFEVPYEILQQARRNGDVAPGAPSDPQILSGLICLSKGAQLFDESFHTIPHGAGIRPMAMLHENYHLYLDGVGWSELSRDFDYAATESRIKAEVFAEELAALETA